jgi:hypothetical protein
MRRGAMSKVIGCALAIVAALIGWRLYAHSGDKHGAADSGRPGVASGSTSRERATTAPDTPADHGSSTHRITRLTPEQRADVRSRIQAARRAHGALSTSSGAQSGGGTSGDDNGAGMATPQQVVDQITSLSAEIGAEIEHCKKFAPDATGFKTQLSLSGDPDIGTLVDAPSPIESADGAPLPHEFDDCIRTNLQALELPPMKTGDKYTVDFDIGL